jgi:tape measure domain-containing protein
MRMTADIATLGIRIDARQVREADGALDHLAQTGRNTEQRIDGVNAAAQRMERVMARVAAALSVAEIVKMADAWANLQGRLSLVADGQQRLAQTTDALFSLAQRTRQGLVATADLYGKISRSTQDLNKTDAERLRLTETINKTLIISGTSQEAAAGSLLQLGQAFGAGALRGEEFNSVLEGMPRLAQAIAEGMGKTTGQLRALAADGKLTSEVLFSSLSRQANKIDTEFAALPTTVGQALTQMQNALLRTIGVFDQSNRLSGSLAHTLSGLAENMGTLVTIAAGLASVKLVNWLTDVITGVYKKIAAIDAAIIADEAQRAAAVRTAAAEVVAAEAAAARAVADRAALVVTQERVVAQLRAANADLAAAEAQYAAASSAGALSTALRLVRDATNEVALAEVKRAAFLTESTALDNAKIAAQARMVAANEAVAVSQVALTAAQGAGATVASWGARALGLLGGPIGAITLALGLGATAWALWGNKAEESTAKAEKSMAEMHAGVMDQLDKQIAKLEERARLMKIAPDVAKGAGPGADDQRRILAQMADVSKDANLTDLARTEILRVLGAQYNETTVAMERAASAQKAVDGQSNAEKLASWMQKHTEYLDKAGKVTAAIAEAKKDLGDAYGPNQAKVDAMIRASFNKQDVDKAKSAYQELVAAIRGKIDEQQIELAVGRNATEAQKQQIKFDEELHAGKLKLAPAQRAVVQGLLDQFAATEKVNAIATTQRDVTREIAEATLARAEAAAGLSVEYANYGKISDARELDMIAVKAEYDMQRKLQALQADGKDITDQVRNQLLAERDARTLVERSIMSQSKALAYADQLRQQNQQFAIDYLPDAKAKAAAQLAIDKAMWQSRISLAEEGTGARERLEAEYGTWLQNQQIKPQLDAWIAMWDSIEQTAHDTFISIMDGGKNMAQRLRDTLKNVLFDWLYQMTLKKWIIDVRAQMTGGAPALTGGTGDVFASAASASSNPLIQAVGAASNLYKSVSNGLSGIGDGIASSIGSGVTSLGQQFGSEALTTFGKGMQGFGADGSLGGMSGLGQQVGSYVGQIGGTVAGYMIGSTLNSAISGKYETGSGVMKVEKVATAVASWFGGPIGGAVAGAISGLVNRAFGMGPTELKASGLRGTLGADGATGQTYQTMHQDGGWFRSDKNWTDTQALTTAMSAQLTQAFQAIKDASGGFATTLGLGADALAGYSKAFDITFTSDAAANQKAIADFFNGVGDELAKMLVPTLDQFSRSGETAAATLERLAGEFQATTAAAQNLGKTAADLFGSVGMDSAAARDRLVALAGGTSTLVSLTSSFAQNFLTDAERMAPVSKALDAALGSLGLSTIPKTNAQFAALVESIKPTDEASAKLLVSLLQLSDAFYQVHTSADAAAKAAQDDLNAKMDAAYSVLERAVAAQKATLQAGYDSAVKQLTTAIDSIKGSVSDLTNLSKTLHDAVSRAAGVDMSRAEGQAQIQAALAIARAGGPLPTADGLKDAIAAVSKDDSSGYSTAEAYQRDRYMSAIALSDLAGVSDNQLSAAERQLATLEATKTALDAGYAAEVARLDGILSTAQRQIDAIKGVDVSVQSVGAALGALQSLFGGNTTAGIVGAYGSSLGRAPDSAGLAYWQQQASNGTSLENITKAIAGSSEATSKIESLYESILGRHGDAGGVAYYQQQLANGASLDTIAGYLRSSDEYLAHITSAPTSTASASTINTTSAPDFQKIVADALGVPLNKIASFTQRAAVAAEDHLGIVEAEQDA